MKTVIQKIGPLIGEAVNGSVFGQPNGSVAVPPYNALVLLSANADNAYIRKHSSSHGFATCSSDGTYGNYLRYQVISQLPLEELRIKVEIASSSDFSTILSFGKFGASTASIPIGSGSGDSSSTLSIVAGTKYYLRTHLITLDGSVIATGATYEVEGVVV